MFHDGRIVSTAGDSVLAEFRSVVDAVRCAVEIQDALKTRNESLPESQQMLFRIGINLGEVAVKGDDLLGDGVNVAARLEGLAQPGGILISSSVYDQITGKLDLGFQDIGEQTLKNISRPIRAFRVSGTSGTTRAENASRLATKLAYSRSIPIVVSAIALAAVAGSIAWMQGWIGGPRVADVHGAAADPAKVKLEADLAVSEKARTEAELRAKTAAAAALPARAEGDAASLRAKAESDAAALKTKAQADAAATRLQATQAQQANRTNATDADAIKAHAENDAAAVKGKAESEAAALSEKAESEAAAVRAKAQADAAAAQSQAAQEAAAAKAAAVASPQPSANASSYDGAWVATYKCSAVGPAPPWTRSAGIVVRDSEFMVERGVPGQPGYDIASGRPAADGTLIMAGNGISGLPSSYGRRYDIRFDGRWTGGRFVLQGTLGARTCDVEIARPAKVSERVGNSHG